MSLTVRLVGLLGLWWLWQPSLAVPAIALGYEPKYPPGFAAP